MVVRVRNLVLEYSNKRVVDNVSFDIKEGEVVGILGRNGAGKTSLIECIEGLKKPTSGYIDVLGLDPVADRKKLYEQIGVQLQEASYPDRIKVNELIKLFKSFYKRTVNEEVLLKQFSMTDLSKSYVNKLSSGERQRLSIILALLPNPKILFFDEITTGLDALCRKDVLRIMKLLKQYNKTMFIVTHYMDEVKALCNRVIIMKNGRIIENDGLNNILRKYSKNKPGEEIELEDIFLNMA